MSEFSRFMKANKKVKANQKYAPTASLTDTDGKPLLWEFRQITSRENEELRNACTVEVPVTGKPNMYRPRLNTEKYLSKMMAAATVYPDLYDEELQDSYGVKTPEMIYYMQWWMALVNFRCLKCGCRSSRDLQTVLMSRWMKQKTD